MDKKEIIGIIEKEVEKISNSSLRTIDESCPLSSTGHNNIGLCSLELVQLLVELESIFHIEVNNKIDTISELAEYIHKSMGELNE